MEGVEFHDGWGEFTAQDVLHSATMLTREDTLLAYATDWRSIDLPASQIVSDHELVVQLKSPNPDFLFYIAPSGGGLMMSKAYWDAEGLEGYTDDMIGTGPYRYVDREFGVNVELKSCPNTGVSTERAAILPPSTGPTSTSAGFPNRPPATPASSPAKSTSPS